VHSGSGVLDRQLILIIAVRVGPGSSNKGLFVRITRDGPGKGEVSVLNLGLKHVADRSIPPYSMFLYSRTRYALSHASSASSSSSPYSLHIDPILHPLSAQCQLSYPVATPLLE
jgi:hypothetical protein